MIEPPPARVAEPPSKPERDLAGRDRMAWNVLATWGGHVVFVVSGFVMPRLIDTHLGQVALGLWDFAWSIVSYFALAQVGVGSSVNRYVAKHRATGDIDALNRTVSSVNVIQIAATLVALLSTVVLVIALPSVFGERLGSEMVAARWMVALLGTAVAVQLAFNVFGGVLTGCHRWDIHNGVTAGAYAVIAASMVVALLAGGGLRALSAAYLAGTLAGELVRMRMAYRTCASLRIHPRLATSAEIRSLTVFGGKTVVDNLSRLLLAQANSILVVSYLGPGALAVYARPGALIRHADTLTNKLSMVLSPAASSLKGSKKVDELRALFVDGTRLTAFLVAPITAFFAVMGGLILQVWMGDGYREGALMAVLAIGSALPLTQRPAGHVLTGLNLHGRVGWASLAVALVGVAGAVLALGPLHAGLLGAAVALVVPYSLGNGVFVLVYACRTVGIPVLEFCRRVFLAPLLSAVPLALGLGVIRAIWDHRPVVALVAGAAWTGAVMLPVFWFEVLPESVRARLMARLGFSTRRPVRAERSPSVAAAVGVGANPVRSLPYPYRAALAICSDLDETPDFQTYWESARFLNTTEQTSMGRGVGLEVGNTIYFDMPRDQFAYWNADGRGRASVRALIRSGHVDCLHSYGDFADTRAHAEKAQEELQRHGCRLEVWIDHAVARSNFGADIMRGSGDLPGSPVYHSDLTCGAGVRYVWRGRVTSVNGQNAPRTLRGMWDPSRPADTGRTVTKEAVKGVLARLGHEKYRIHGDNALLQVATLRDGRKVHEFLRANPHPLGVSRGDTATGIAEVLTAPMLDRLVERGAMTLLYTHLGKIRSRQEPFEAETRATFQSLAERARQGEILVTTTRRLLGYCEVLQRADVSVSSDGDWQRIDVRIRADETGAVRASDFEGLTFYVRNPAQTRVFVEGEEVLALQRNPPDQTGRRSVTIPWSRLEFPSM